MRSINIILKANTLTVIFRKTEREITNNGIICVIANILIISAKEVGRRYCNLSCLFVCLSDCDQALHHNPKRTLMKFSGINCLYKISKRRSNRRRDQPIFPIELWNVYARTEQALPRANNYVEAFHNASNK